MFAINFGWVHEGHFSFFHYHIFVRLFPLFVTVTDITLNAINLTSEFWALKDFETAFFLNIWKPILQPSFRLRRKVIIKIQVLQHLPHIPVIWVQYKLWTRLLLQWSINNSPVVEGLMLLEIMNLIDEPSVLNVFEVVQKCLCLDSGRNSEDDENYFWDDLLSDLEGLEDVDYGA